jgi:ABC-type polysaccharide/polyol phosphate transport system ATPase subunit
VTPATGGGPPIIEARGLSKQFLLRHNRSLSIKSRVLAWWQPKQRERVEPFWALQDISLSIGRGERVGLVGRNGSGKSTLLKLIAGIHRPTDGHLLVARGTTIGTMIELGVGFHPDLTGTENVFLNAAIHGRSREEIEAMYPRVVEYSGLERFMDVALKNYSSGMHLRLGFAIAANLDPDVILLDEVFAVGDEDFQKKCLATIDRFSAEGRTIIFVSHAAAAVQRTCRRVCVLDGGRLQFDGDVERGLAAYHKLLTVPVSVVRGGADGPDDPQAGDLATRARRQLAGWAFGVLQRDGFRPEDRVVEIGIEPAADPRSPMLSHVGPARYVYWQVDSLPRPVAGDFDVVVAPAVMRHLPLNAIARMLATGLRLLGPDGRLYFSFFEAPASDPFAPIAWPGGFTTFSDAVPYHYTFEMVRGIASAFGGRVERVPEAAHPNGETMVVVHPARDDVKGST